MHVFPVWWNIPLNFDPKSAKEEQMKEALKNLGRILHICNSNLMLDLVKQQSTGGFLFYLNAKLEDTIKKNINTVTQTTTSPTLPPHTHPPPQKKKQNTTKNLSEN